MKSLIRSIVALVVLAFPLVAAAQFNGITNGPSTNTSCQAAPGLYFDLQDSVLAACGKSHVLVTHQIALLTSSATTAVTTVTTAQSMATLALGASLQNVAGRTVRVCGAGIYTSPGTTTPTMTIQLTEGGITPVAITTAALSATASTSLPFSFCFVMTTVATGATGTLEAHGILNANISANTAAAAVATYADTNTAVSSTLDLTAANTLAVQVAASSALTSVQLRQLTVELIS